MTTTFLDYLPLWGFLLVAITLLVISLEGGYRLGKWRHKVRSGEKEAPVGAMVGSILGLLAIILAFTFNLAASRFDDRRKAILEEANAIGTTYLRSQLLPDPTGQQIAQLLREYVDLRIRIVQEGTIPEGLVKSEEIQDKLWALAVTASTKTHGTPTTNLFIQSLNNVIDMHAKRVFVGLNSRIPSTMWLGLFSLALLGMISMGYQVGLSATKRSVTEVLLVLSFAGVMFMIVDLDRAQEGLLKVGQQALVDLQKSMQKSR